MNLFQAQMHQISSYHILSLESSLELLIFPIMLSVLQVIIVVKLIIASIGEKITSNKMLILSLIIAVFVQTTRIFIGAPFHIFINTLAIAIIIALIARIRLLKSLIGTIFAHITIIAGSIIIVEPIFILGNEKILHYTFTNAIGYSIGMLLEIIVPTIILFIFTKYNIVLLGRNIR